jgi:NAD(P)-dependent dehydrogenase (short-subunit alcohol dehydrogenase family)
MSSMGGRMSFAGFSAYSGTKFALEGMTEALADEVRPLGITTLIVEPGSFRTSLMDNVTTSTGELPDYADTVGATRKMAAAGSGNITGDPAKAAAVILAALDAEDTPLHLPLGPDGVEAVSSALTQVQDEIAAWRTRATATSFEA